MTQDLPARVRAILADHIGVGPSRVEDDATSLADDLLADSLDCVEICMAMEDEFGIDIPDADATEIETVGDVIDLVREALGESVAETA